MALSSTIEYCENQDVFDAYSRISDFDIKRRLSATWAKSGSDYYYYNSGSVTRLFKNGEDLGGPEEDPLQINRPNEWIYNAQKDYIHINQATALGGTNPNSDIYEAGDIWEDVIERFRRKASRLVESRLGKSITREILKDREGNYPTSIIRLVALKTAILLIMAHNPTHDDLPALKAEYGEIRDKIISGKIVMTGHRSENDSKGTIRFVSGIGTITLQPVEVIGSYTGSGYELLKILVTKSGVIGVAEMTVSGKSSTALKSKVLKESEIITGDYQSLGIGDLYVRWGTALLNQTVNLNTEWEIELWGNNIKPTVSQTKAKTLSRGTLWL